LKNTSIKTKVIVNVVVSFFVIALTIIYINYNDAMDTLENNVEREFKNFETLFNSTTNTQAVSLQMALETMINDKDIVRFFANGERKKLENLLLPIYKKSLKPTYGIRQFQLHVPPATSFLRLHKPSKFGDDLSAFRATVTASNLQKKASVGIEVGRGGPGLRAVIPIKNFDGSHIGTIEFGGSLVSILKDGAKLFDMEYAIGIKESVFLKARRFKGKETDIRKDELIYYQYSSDKSRHFIKKMPRVVVDRTVINGSHASFSFAVYDFMGNVAGFVTLSKDLTLELEAIDNKMLFFIMTMFGFMLVVSLVMAFVLTRTLKPLNEFVEVLNSLTSGEKGGDLTRHIEIHEKDEIGLASESINKFIDLTRKLINDIKEEAEQSIKLNNRITTLSSDVLKTTKDQRNHMNVAYNISVKVKSLAGNSELNAESSLVAVLEEARLIANMMSDLEALKHSMEKVSHDGEALSKNIIELKSEVGGVKEITQLIASVAEQTNLLALNASIEAARAGEKGKGFAVVADEIHKLSEETQHALREIDKRIDELTDLVTTLSKEAYANSSSVNSMTESVDKVSEDSSTMLMKSEHTIKATEMSKGSSSAIIKSIAELSNHISDTVQISNRVDQTSGKLSDVSNTMSSAMSNLTEQMSKFKTKIKEELKKEQEDED
jgi:methyl-accepting chemotaxis protein